MTEEDLAVLLIDNNYTTVEICKTIIELINKVNEGATESALALLNHFGEDAEAMAAYRLQNPAVVESSEQADDWIKKVFESMVVDAHVTALQQYRASLTVNK